MRRIIFFFYYRRHLYYINIHDSGGELNSVNHVITFYLFRLIINSVEVHEPKFYAINIFGVDFYKVFYWCRERSKVIHQGAQHLVPWGGGGGGGGALHFRRETKGAFN